MIGEQVGQYRLEALLGQGGFGAVYRGIHVHMDSIKAAIKVAHADLARDPDFEKMMRRECEILYGLSHPNIVRFRDLIVEDGVLAVAMELLEGEELTDRLERGPMEPAQVLDLVHAMFEGLAYAHAKGVSHRDIKPANVFLCTDGSVKLMDFGIAKATNSTRATRSGMVSGTVDYMAPERFSGHSSPAADVYAVGLVAWELLTGRTACPDGDLPSKLGWHLGRGAPRLSEVIPDCPAWLADLVAGWCTIEIEDRPPTAAEALEQLRLARTEHGQEPLPRPKPRPVSAPQPTPTPPRRRGLRLLPVLAGLALLLAGGVVLLAVVILGPLRTLLEGPNPVHGLALGQIHEYVMAFEAIADNDQRLQRSKIAALQAVEGAAKPATRSENLDLAVEAFTMVAHCRWGMGNWLVETDCTGEGETRTCGEIHHGQQEQARLYLELARETFIKIEQRLEAANVHDERHAEAQALTADLEGQLAALEEAWGHSHGPVEEIEAMLPQWVEHQARLESCRHGSAQRILDDVRPFVDQAHQAVERQDGPLAEKVMARVETLSPRVERALERCP